MCGLTGFFNIEHSLQVLKDLTDAQQYRGEQSAGLALVSKSGNFFADRALGLCANLFGRLEKQSSIFPSSEILSGISHLRYGTAGQRKNIDNAQPFYGRTTQSEFYLGHNGDTPNFEEMRNALAEQGAVFSKNSDTELLVKLIENHSIGQSPLEGLRAGLRAFKGTYSVVLIFKDRAGPKLIAARDPFGNRPLFLGKLGQGWVIASEDSAFETVNAKVVQEIKPGTMIVISSDSASPQTTVVASSPVLRQCVYEQVYFSFPKSRPFGSAVHRFRLALGRHLAKQFGNLVLPGNIVTNPPDSSNYLSDGFCKELGILPARAILRRHSSDFIKTFTQDDEDSRDQTLRRKFSLVEDLIAGEVIWLIDDSIVRGRTSRKLVRALREMGARWVGVLSGCPPLIGPCQKGMDFDQLIATKYLDGQEPKIEKIRQDIEADFLGYLSMDRLQAALQETKSDPNDFCFGCFENREPLWNKW